MVEGRLTAIYERQRPLPPTLDLMLNGGRDATGFLWRPLRVVSRAPLKVAGARRQCAEQEHRLRLWMMGFQIGRDAVIRQLQLDACADCGAVCIRDRSFDAIDRLPTGNRPLRRRSHVVGWYSGARPRNRLFT
jgi:hypothetical protein